MIIELRDEQKIKVINSDDVFRIMKDILKREQKINCKHEFFWVISLASDDHIENIELLDDETSNQAKIEPSAIFRFAVTKKAVKIILVHNHLNNDIKPSELDKDITDRLIQSGIILNVPVIDHLIITPTTYMSFAAIGLMNELKDSFKYMPPFMIEHNTTNSHQQMQASVMQASVMQASVMQASVMHESQQKLQKVLENNQDTSDKSELNECFEKGIYQTKLDMAQKARELGIPNALIAQITALSIEEIEKLPSC